MSRRLPFLVVLLVLAVGASAVTALARTSPGRQVPRPAPTADPWPAPDVAPDPPPPTPIPTPTPTSSPTPTPAPEAPRPVTVSLTFDDGPSPRWTPRVLEVLARYEVRATFFVVGVEAERHPDLVRAIVAAGHRVEGHTWDHHALTGIDEATFAHQVDHTNARLAALTGQPVTCVRPPGGAVDDTTRARLAARGLGVAMWSHDTRDWTRPGVDAIVFRATADLEDGAVVILHDGGGDRSQTVAALPIIIERARTAGAVLTPACG